ncbi:MAG: SDR family NAD(P)-dependent oxidoreductase, partial [Ginsengibacter sp.]
MKYARRSTVNDQRTTASHKQGKVIIIGATSGMGRELAKLFARKGYMVAASGRRNELLISLQKKFPKNIATECFDVTGKENILHLRNMIEKLDGVDIIIYCSGYGEVSEQLDRDIEKQTTEVSVYGFVEIISYAFNYFFNQGYGQIACISSIASIRGNAYAPAYNAGKAYQSNYMEG